jgi:hypothetical protein
MNNQFGGHEGMIATNPSVLQELDAGGTSWNLAGNCCCLAFGSRWGEGYMSPTRCFAPPICEGPLSG